MFTITNCTTLYKTYPLLYYEVHIQITYNPNHHKSTDKNNAANKVTNSELHTITNCTTLYRTYPLLYYEGYIQIT